MRSSYLRPSGRRKTVLFAAVAAALAATPAMGQLRSFREAEGFGALATGGRGGSVYHVTNLNNSGAGSFRDAVSVSNRIVVFDVGGIINLTSAVSCQSNLTILGQTAPGAGISFNGGEIGFSSRSNIICRYVRFRPGDNTASTTDDCLGMYNSQNVIVDHCSLEFAPYDNIDAVTDNGNDSMLTFQHNIIADPIGQQFGAHLEAVNGHITLADNLWANSHNRNPLAKCNEQFINNVDYNNEASYTTHTSTPFKHDLVNNAFVWGPATSGNTYYQLSSGDTFYAAGNLEDSNKDGSFNGSTKNPATGTIVGSPNFSSTLSLPTLSTSAAYQYVIAHAGASLSRDDLDNLVISQVQTLGLGTAGKGVGTAGPSGGEYGSAASTGLANGGLGNTAGGIRPAGFDTDNDGVPDAWESVHGMNPADPSDALKLNPLGYPMIEQYANDLGDENNTVEWTTGTPGVYDHATIRGTGATNGSMTVTTALSLGTAPAMLSLSIGGNGPASGETLTVSGSGRLNVYDTITVGEFNNAIVNVTGSGVLSGYTIQLGNTDYSGGGAGVSYTGTLNLSGGTLQFSSLVLGAGTPGNWSGGGSVNWSGGTIKPLANFFANVPMQITGAGGTLDTNSFTGTIVGTISGSKGITKTGAGTVTLSGANAYTGATTIKTGTLIVPALSNGGAPGNLGASTSDAANLVLDGGTLAYGAPTGSAATTTDRSFTLTANGGTLDGGTGPQWRWLGTADIVASGSGNRTLTLSGTTSLNDLYLGLGDPAAGGKTSLTKIGTGRWILNGSGNPRSYSGDTTVSAGTLMTNVDNPLPFGASKGNLVIANAATFELNGHNLAINGLNGAGTLNQRGNVTRTLTLGYGDASGSFAGPISNVPSSGTAVLNLVKTGNGTQTLGGANTYSGTTSVNGGTLVLGKSLTSSLSVYVNNNGRLQLPSDGTTLKVIKTGLVAVGDTGRIDLADNKLITSASVTAVTPLIASGRNGGTWNGSGIVTSQSDATTGNFTSLGVATASEVKGVAPTETSAWAGQTVTGSDTLVMYTYGGDANLDGKINVDDYGRIDSSIPLGIAGWYNGDFNYDGKINVDDYGVIDSNIGIQGPAFSASAGIHPAAIAAVPEPSGVCLAILSAQVLTRRRPRRRR